MCLHRLDDREREERERDRGRERDKGRRVALTESKASSGRSAILMS